MHIFGDSKMDNKTEIFDFNLKMRSFILPVLLLIVIVLINVGGL